MNFITLLRKLGILRFGSKKGVYHSEKDMPDELFMEVGNADKELIHKKDFDFLRKKKKKTES